MCNPLKNILKLFVTIPKYEKAFAKWVSLVFDNQYFISLTNKLFIQSFHGIIFASIKKKVLLHNIAVCLVLSEQKYLSHTYFRPIFQFWTYWKDKQIFIVRSDTYSAFCFCVLTYKIVNWSMFVSQWWVSQWDC